jgi:hypothetical protein
MSEEGRGTTGNNATDVLEYRALFVSGPMAKKLLLGWLYFTTYSKETPSRLVVYYNLWQRNSF